jgi:selenocysteine lyase/cysteine desulfurase
LLETLPAYKLEPASDALPDRWMTGTQNHEGLAGFVGAMDYLAEIGAAYPEHQRSFPGLSGQRLLLRAALLAIQTYEQDLAARLLQGLAERPQFTVWGIADPGRVAQRVPTISITHARLDPLRVAQHLAQHDIFAWHGNLYALELTKRLGLEDRGGFVRLGLLHYNTKEEIDTLLHTLDML